jgi:helix-turn-helix protein
MPRSTEKRSTQQRPDVSTDQRERGYFAQIPLSLLNDTRPEVTAYVRLVYAAIHSYCTFGTTTGAHPKTAQLAKRMGCSERQVNYAREALRALGYVSWKTGSKRHSQGNLYTLYPAGDGPGVARESAPPAPNQETAAGVKSAPLALRRVHHLHSDECTTCTPQRPSNREPVTEKFRGKCSHPDTACCPRCLTAIVVSRPVSSPLPTSEEPSSDLIADEF